MVMNNSCNLPIPVTPSFGGSGIALTPTFEVPITPFVVGPVGLAAYQVIQTAINDCDAAGGGAVYIMRGMYTENLTLSNGVNLIGVDQSIFTVVISGTHTPDPAAGLMSINSINLFSAGNIFSSAAAGAGTVLLQNCHVNCNGLLFNLLNWTGTLYAVNCFDDSTSNGIVNNTGGATLFMQGCSLGTDAATMNTSGPTNFINCFIDCAWNMSDGTFAAVYSNFSQLVTLLTTASGALEYCALGNNASAPALTMSSSNTVLLNACSINANADPVISGAGTGSLVLDNVSFFGLHGIAGTLTIVGAGALRPPGDLGLDGYIFTSNGNAAVPTWQPAGVSTTIVTSPPDSNTATTAFGSITAGTAKQNTLGYDILVNITVSVTASIVATLVLGVGPTITPTTNTVIPTFTVGALTFYTFTAIVPTNYYVLVNSTGTITISSINAQVCPL